MCYPTVNCPLWFFFVYMGNQSSANMRTFKTKGLMEVNKE